MTFYATFQVKNITQTSTETQIREMLPIILLPSSSSFLQGFAIGMSQPQHQSLIWISMASK